MDWVVPSSESPRRASAGAQSRRRRIWARPNAAESEFLATVGVKAHCHVLTRRPLTVAFARWFWVPALLFSFLVGERWYPFGAYSAFAAAAVCACALLFGPIVHEGGHLLFARKVKGVTPRMLLVRSVGGVAIVEGRYEDARGAALFAAGGLLGTLAYVVALVTLGSLVPGGAFKMALLLPAVVNAGLLVVNLVPVAPSDGYLIFRAGLWAGLGSRADAEQRAIRWSRGILVYCLLGALVVLSLDEKSGLLALLVVATLLASHRVAASRAAASST